MIELLKSWSAPSTRVKHLLFAIYLTNCSKRGRNPPILGRPL